jgi:hypothetical protein
MVDNVQSPAHYSGEGLECIDVIESALGAYGFRAFCLGNVLKYSWRHRLKGGAEDLAKAEVYRAWAIAGTAAHRPKGAKPLEVGVPTLADVDLSTDPRLLAELERAESDDGPDGLKAGEA